MKPDRIKPFVSCLQPALAEAGSAQQTLLCTNLINRGGEDESGAINTAPSRGQEGTAQCHSWAGDPEHRGGATWELNLGGKRGFLGKAPTWWRSRFCSAAVAHPPRKQMSCPSVCRRQVWGCAQLSKMRWEWGGEFGFGAKDGPA